MSAYVLITGGSGFIGKALVKAMTEQGYLVTVFSRSITNNNGIFSKEIKIINKLSNEEDEKHPPYDIIINLAGEAISQYWTESLKQKIINSRKESNNLIVNYIDKAKIKPSLLIAASGVGYYGTSLEERFTEKSEPSKENEDLFVVSLCKEIEKAARNAEEFKVRTCFLRIGAVLEKDGGILSKLLTPYKLGVGGKLGNGNQWLSWIHRDDLIGAIFHIISHKHIHGPVNITAPNPVTNEDFTEILAKTLKRPAFINLPKFYVKLILGQMGNELLLSGQNVIPKILMDGNFNYKYPTLQDALRAIFNK